MMKGDYSCVTMTHSHAIKLGAIVEGCPLEEIQACGSKKSTRKKEQTNSRGKRSFILRKKKKKSIYRSHRNDFYRKAYTLEVLLRSTYCTCHSLALLFHLSPSLARSLSLLLSVLPSATTDLLLYHSYHWVSIKEF